MFYFANSTGVDLIAQVSVGEYCYAVDDQTVALTDRGGTLPLAGQVVAVDSVLGVAVGVGTGFASPYETDSNIVSGGSSLYKARGAAFTNHSLTAFTVATNTDGITYVAGDIVLLTAQTTPAENGPYVVGTVATTAPLTRPSWWGTGATIVQGQVIQVGGEGTVFGGSEWKALCAKAQVIGTNDPILYPRIVKGSVALTNGTVALGVTQGLFLKSVSASQIVVTRRNAGGTLTLTTGYYCPDAASARVAGVAGTAVATITASVAAGTVNTADTSTIDFVVTNW